MKKRMILALLLLSCLPSAVVSCGGGRQSTSAELYRNPVCHGIDNDSFYMHDGKYYIVQNNGGSIYIQAVDDPVDADFRQMKLAVEMQKEYGLTHLWYPCLTMIDGKWYIYVTADDGNTDNHKMYVLVNDNASPLEGRFRLAGRLVTDHNDNWAIHGYVFRHEGRLYMVWSGWQSKRSFAEKQCIYISEMLSPTEMSGKRVMISCPEYDWELQWMQRDGESQIRYPVFVNEHPFFFCNEMTDKAYVYYSASAHWTAYCCIGELWADKDADLLDASSWHKTPHPVFSENRECGIYGPSAPVILPSRDRKSWHLMYSATDSDRTRHSRALYLQPISFSSEGHPEFGKPLPREKKLPRITSASQHT